jgi:hypothetical protein
MKTRGAHEDRERPFIEYILLGGVTLLLLISKGKRKIIIEI